jgi:general stress protein YciG
MAEASWHLGCSPLCVQRQRWLASNESKVPVWEAEMAKEDRGFASMDRDKQREIASKGGKAAHQKGTAHEWTSEEAREAGRKGGMVSHRQQQDLREASTQENPSSE